jgi:hypothetical protein
MTSCYRYTLRKDGDIMIDTFFTERQEAEALAEYVLEWLEKEMHEYEHEHDLYDYILSGDFEFAVDNYVLEAHTEGGIRNVPGYRREKYYVWACGSKGLKSIDEISGFLEHI